MTEITGLEVSKLRVGKVSGASPSNDQYYVLILFDISDSKKYRRIVKLLKSYGNRIQRSVFEAYLKPAHIRELLSRIDSLMASERYFNPDDNVRVYKVSGGCEITVFGHCADTRLEEDIFF